MDLREIYKLSPAQFEMLICNVLTKQEYAVTPIELGGNVGIDIISIKDNKKVGIQVKKYINRKVNLETIYHTYGAAAFYDCTHSAIVILGELISNVKNAAKRLRVKVWGKEFALNCDESLLSVIDFNKGPMPWRHIEKRSDADMIMGFFKNLVFEKCNRYNCY